MITLDGTLGITTPSETNTGTLSVTGVTTLTGGLNAALPVLSGGTGVTTKTGTGAVVLGTSPTLTTPTIDSAQLATISGTAPLYMCRAWVNFNGSGTPAIRGSGNVSSITDNGTGDFAVNFTTAMPDVNYVVCGQGSPAGADARFQFESGTARTTSVYKLLTTNAAGVLTDGLYINIAAFR
jgi:hypothetical protein